MTDDLNEKLDYVRDRVVADAKAKPTPEEIMRDALKSAPGRGAARVAGWQIKALTAAGYVIVGRGALKNLLQAQVRSDKLTDQIIDELTTDTST